MKLSGEAQAWLAGKVQAILARHHLSEPERAGVYYELMSHLHGAGERKAQEAGRDEVTVGDLQAALLEMGGEAALEQAFVAPRVTPLKRAGVIARSGAVVVDYVVILIVEAAVTFGVSAAIFFALWPFGLSGGFDTFHILFHNFGGGPPLFVAFTVLVILGYFTFFEGRQGRTPGKKVFNLRVLRADGAPVTHREAAIRNLVKVFPPLLVLDTIFMIVFFYDQKQRVSDRLAETIVVEGI